MAATEPKLMPSDIRFAYVTSGLYFAALLIGVLAGPSLFLIGSVCLTLPVIFGAGFWMLSQLIAGERLRPRTVPLLLVFLSAASFFVNPVHFCAELHVMVRIYRAGGPNHLNDWAQGLIQHYPGYGQIVNNETNEGVPAEFQHYLQGWIDVWGKPEEIPPRMHIEMGGGFYHFGIVIVSSASAPEPTWLHRLLNWPPEVGVYHDNS